MMRNHILGLIINFIGGMLLGHNLAPSWFGFVEILGTTALIGCVACPFPTQINWLRKFRIILFLVGGLSIQFAVYAASYIGFNIFIGWSMVMCFWMTLNIADLNLTNVTNTIIRTFLLYISAGLGLGFGYLG